MSNQLELRDGHGLPMVKPIDEATGMLQVISQAVADPRMDVEKMRALLDMHKEIMADRREQAFIQAVNRVQAKIPQIEKDGIIYNKDRVTVRSRFTKYKTIDKTIKPLLMEEGLTLSFDSKSTDGKLFEIIATLAHIDGHSKTKTITLPIDASDYRTPIQSISSTISNGRRILTKMHFNIVEKEEDDNADLITEDQAKDLEALITEVGADKARFLKFMGAESIAAIYCKDYKKAVNALQEKRRK